jgi:hypothetical protein
MGHDSISMDIIPQNNPSGQSRVHCAHHPKTKEDEDLKDINRLYLATIDRNLPLETAGNNSAPKVKIEGTDPPMPSPATILIKMSTVTEGANAEARPAIELIAREY